ncbi:hypothetical protein SHANETTE_55 [Bacillus phage Shanette]|uniref:Uncharacterized protein n=1 Tax=Bacillus phage Shanette TaxID=1296656 RepID=S5MMK5_9CAUD|nr:hypothetical protein AVV46_gp055 [Bacillus phage Shanette]AGR46955.1 hypothetical protein SHANETTE_55 [Bacillus phage Shanette]
MNTNYPFNDSADRVWGCINYKNYNHGVWIITIEYKELEESKGNRLTVTLGTKAETINYIASLSVPVESPATITSIVHIQNNGAIFRYALTIDSETNTFGLLETTRLSCATTTVRPTAPRNPNKND